MSGTVERLKLLLVIDNLGTGGAQRQIVNLATGLRRRKHQVDLFCYYRDNMLANPLYTYGVRVHCQLKHHSYSTDVILNLRKLIKHEHYDLIISFLSTPNFYALVASRALDKRLPVIVSERFCDLTQGINLSEFIVRRFYQWADHVIFNSHHQRMNFARKYRFLHGRISTIYNGYDLHAFSPPLFEPQNNPMRLVTIASVSPYKNGLCLVEALRILGERYSCYPSVTWIGQHVMAGERLEYLRKMERSIRAFKLDQRWTWFGQCPDIVEQLHRHDVLVHPSYGEGLPNVVCEALACGRPVIVSNVLDHSKLVQHDLSGYLFNFQDPSDLAERIRQFIELSREERRNMGCSGRRYAEAHLSLDRFVDDYEQLIARLMASKHSCSF